MVKLFTHTDLDGVGCAVLASLAFDNDPMFNSPFEHGEFSVEFCDYNVINEKVRKHFEETKDLPNVKTFITDISIGEELAEEIDKSGADYVLLDHHPTALGLNKFNWCKVVVEKEDTGVKTSGTELFYEYLLSKKLLYKDEAILDFVSRVKTYDTWLWVEKGNFGQQCKDLNDLFHIFGKTRFMEWVLSYLCGSEFVSFGAGERMMLNIEHENIARYIAQKSESLYITKFQGKKCGIVFAEKYISELGNTLCKNHTEIDFVAIVNPSQSVSFRTTKDDIDLGKDVAPYFGGGGHPKAAGASISKEKQIEAMKIFFEN